MQQQSTHLFADIDATRRDLEASLANLRPPDVQGREWYAVHEAGHAVVAALTGMPFRDARLLSDDVPPYGAVTPTWRRFSAPSRDRDVRRVRLMLPVLFGGAAAESLRAGAYRWTGGGDDIARTIVLLRRLQADRPDTWIGKRWAANLQRAATLLAANWRAVDLTAARLLRDGAVGARTIRGFLM